MSQVFQTINPANQEVLQQYEFDSDQATQNLLVKSDLSFKKWKFYSVQQRIEQLRQVQNVLQEHVEPLAALATLEMGKPIEEAKGEVLKCLGMMDFYFEHATKFLEPQELNSSFEKAMIHYCPQGIILGIMPWNFPYWQVLRFAIPTLLAGNVVIIKHAPNVQGCQNLLQKLIDEALQKSNLQGIFSTAIATNEQVSTLIADKRVRGVSFTGSERVGRLIAEQAGRHLKKVVLELGGSDAYLVNEDADLEQAVEHCIKARFLNSGQSCVAAKRWIVHAKIYDQFLSLAQQKVKALPSGVLARMDLKMNLLDQVKRSLAQGASIASGNWQDCQHEDCYFSPLILEGVRPAMAAFEEELFGPVACLIKAASLDEMIELSNQSHYGLGGAIFMQDVQQARQIADQHLDTGGVFINQMLQSSAPVPFGGVKASGIGRELSHLSLYEFANLKTVVN